MSFTLTSLKTAVKDYCETSESTFDTQLTTFIQEAEERILKNVELPVLERTSQELPQQATHIFQRQAIFSHRIVWLLYQAAYIATCFSSMCLLFETTRLTHQQLVLQSITLYLMTTHLSWVQHLIQIMNSSCTISLDQHL